MVGECNILLKSGGIWEKLVMDATDGEVLIVLDLDAVQEVLKQLKLTAVNDSIAPNSAHSSQELCMVSSNTHMRHVGLFCLALALLLF